MDLAEKTSLNLPEGAFFLPVPDEFNSQVVAMPISFADQFPDDIFSCDEIEKEKCYLKQDDRKRHRSAHGLKRFVLSQLCNCHPRALAFELTGYGKPSMLSKSPHANISFNLSHSGRWIMAGFSAAFDIGVDVESPKNIDISAMLDLVMHPKDESDNIVKDFYNTWVMKEACVKAIGTGINEPLSSFFIRSVGEHEYHSIMQDGRVVDGWYSCLEDGAPFAIAICER